MTERSWFDRAQGAREAPGKGLLGLAYGLAMAGGGAAFTLGLFPGLGEGKLLVRVGVGGVVAAAGVFFVVTALRALRDLKRYGAATLEADDAALHLGGHFAGTVVLERGPPGVQGTVTLRCLATEPLPSYGQQQRVHVHEERAVTVDVTATPGEGGAWRAPFSLAIPADAPASGVALPKDNGDAPVTWHLDASLGPPGKRPIACRFDVDIAPA